MLKITNDYNIKMLVSNNKQYIKNLSICIDYDGKKII